MSCLSSPPLRLVELHKERHMRSLNRVSIEQTDMTVPDSARGEPSKWRSIAVEGARENIVKFLETKIHGAGSSGDGRERSLGDRLREVGGEPRGYAQFVMDLTQVTQPAGSSRDAQQQCTAP